MNSERTVGDLAGIFENEPARQAMDQSQVVYRVSAHLPVSDGTEAGLFYGASYLEPGRVGDEYFMTKGHFHQKRHAAEYYWGIRGDGVLLLMDEQRRCWGERVTPGSLHYIPGNVAHRLVNVGDETLAVGACWPSDAGHDYATIAELGFSSRIKCVDGVPELAPVGA
ncbi:MAG: glucose-6-phosphate isomerase family protein [Planctomycetota bacterium]